MSELKLQVVLEAAERISAPALKAMSGVKGLTDEVKDAKKELVSLNKSQKNLDGFKKLKIATSETANKLELARGKAKELAMQFKAAHQPSEKLILQLKNSENALLGVVNQVSKTSKELVRARLESRKLKRQFEKTDKPTKKLEISMRAAGKRVTRLTEKTEKLNIRLAKSQARTDKLTVAFKGTHKPTQTLVNKFDRARNAVNQLKDKQIQQTRSLDQLRGSLNEAGYSTNRLTRAQRDITQATDRANQSIKNQAMQLKKVYAQQAKIKKLSDQRAKTMQTASNLTIVGAGAMATGRTVLDKMISPMKAALTFESAMADVKKVTGFNTEEFKVYGKELDKLTWKIPLTVEELAAISASGGQLGIADKDLKGFTVMVAKMSTAFDMLPDAAGDATAKMMNIYKLNIQQAGELADAINHLSDDSASKAREMVMAMSRIGGVATQFGLTEIQAASLANAFISLGKPPEVAATAINSMLQKLQTAEKQPKKFQKALLELGVTSEGLAKKINDKPQEALFDFLKLLEKTDKRTRAGLTVDLFGTEFSDDVSLLVGNLDIYQKALDNTADKQNFLGSVLREFDVRNATRANKIKLVGQAYNSVKRSIGDFLLDSVIPLIQKAGLVLEKINQWVEANPALAATIGKVVLIAGAALVVMGGLSMALAAVIGPLAILRFSFGMLGIKSLGLMTTLKKLSSIFMVVGRVALPIVATGLRMIAAALIANPIGAVIAIIAGGAALIISNWDTIGPRMSESMTVAWENVKGIFTTALADMKEKPLQFFATLPARMSLIGFEIINGLVKGLLNYDLKAKIISIADSVISSFKNVLGIASPSKVFAGFGGDLMRGLIMGIKNKMKSVQAAISNIGEKVTSWFKSKLGINSPSRVFIEHGHHINQGLALGIEQSADQAIAPVTNIASRLPKAVAVAALTMPMTLAAATEDPANHLQPTASPTATYQAQNKSSVDNSTYHINISIESQPGMNERELSEEVGKQLRAWQRDNQLRSRANLYDDGDFG